MQYLSIYNVLEFYNRQQTKEKRPCNGRGDFVGLVVHNSDHRFFDPNYARLALEMQVYHIGPSIRYPIRLQKTQMSGKSGNILIIFHIFLPTLIFAQKRVPASARPETRTQTKSV
jgi:hypothetical protein